MTAALDFATDLLHALGIEPNDVNVPALIGWQAGEGTHAHFNPLATTMPAEGATDFNGAGVKNYPDYATGIDATVRTLHNGDYGPILDALLHATDVAEVEHAVTGSPWGTRQFGSLTWPGFAENDRPAGPPPPPPPEPAPTPHPGSFPLPDGAWYGPPSANPDNHSGYVWLWDRQGIAEIQRRLGITPDGLFGPQTEAHVVAFQRAHPPLTVDGLVGPRTWAALFPAPVMPTNVAAAPAPPAGGAAPVSTRGL